MIFFFFLLFKMYLCVCVFYFTYVMQYTRVRYSASLSFPENWAGGSSTILKFSGSRLERVSPKKVFFSAITYHLPS